MMALDLLPLVLSHQAGWRGGTDLAVNKRRLEIRVGAIRSVKVWGFIGTVYLPTLKRSVKSLWKALN